MLRENPDDRPNIEHIKKRVEELRISPPTKKKVPTEFVLVLNAGLYSTILYYIFII